MRSVKSSELKAKLAKYLRLVRKGEVIQVLDRGIPIATIRGEGPKSTLETSAPIEDPSRIGELTSGVKNVPATDIVELLKEDRRKR